MSDSGLSDLSAVLWHERELMELLLFKLDEEQLVLAAGKHEWLPRATREVEVVLAKISEAEMDRSVVVARVGQNLGLGTEPSLRELAAKAPEPWGDLLLDHRKSFTELAGRIQGIAEANRDLVRSAKSAADQVIAALAEDDNVSTYARGGRESQPRRARLLDGAM